MLGDHGVKTEGPRILRHDHLDAAKTLLIEGVTKLEFERLKYNWAAHDKSMTWNPFDPVGSDIAKQSPTNHHDSRSASSPTINKRY